MKKTLIALAAVAVSSAAMAQVTMSGYINYQYNKDGTNASTKGMNDAGLTFTASEDLGNGLKATGVINIDTLVGRTGDAKNGDSSLSLSGGFGSITAARTRAPNFAARGNVFGAVIGKGFNDGIVYTRPEVQAVSYTSPALIPGLQVSVATSNLLAANVANTGNNTATNLDATTIGATYTSGPLSLGVQRKTGNDAAKAAAPLNAGSQTEAFVTYNAGVAVIGYGYGSKELNAGDAVTSYGISVPMGAFTLGVDAAKRGDAEYLNYGARYALSKRTTLHVSMGSYQTTTTNSADQRRIRLAHSF